MDRKRLDRIIKEEVAGLLEARGGREYGINPTTGFPEEPSAYEREAERRSFLKSVGAGGYDEPDDPPGMEEPRERPQQSAAVSKFLNAPQRTGMSSVYGKKGTVEVGPDGAVVLPEKRRYMWLLTPAVQGQEEPIHAESRFIIDDIKGVGKYGERFGAAFVEYNRDEAMQWRVLGYIDGGAPPIRGEGPDVESAYMGMLSKAYETVKLNAARPGSTDDQGNFIRGGGYNLLKLGNMLRRTDGPNRVTHTGGPGEEEAPLSESRWAQLAGLMVEGGGRGKFRPGPKRRDIYVDPDYPEEMGMARSMAKAAGLRGLEGGETGDVTLTGPMTGHQMFHTQMSAAGGPTSGDEFPYEDLYEDDEMEDEDPVDEAKPHGKGAAPGSYRPPASPDPKKSGPPGREDLEKISKAGPFEGRRRR